MDKTIKLITYNIDGLPTTLDLNDPPWLLKPIAWIYKLIKGTTIIKINDNDNKASDIENISKYLSSSEADVIAVQEDFNYHNELTSSLNDNYMFGKYLGGFDLSKLFKNTEWLTYFPLPRFKCDGINIIAKKSRVNLNTEDIKRWKKCNGYFTHANDALTHKGFRYYTICIDKQINLDVYVLHMDADFYDVDKCPDISRDLKARKSQLNQLVEYINKTDTNNPIIVIGDTNSYNKYVWDVVNIQENLIDAINDVDGLAIEEAIPTNYSDCDRLFYVNNDKSKYQLSLNECSFDTNITSSDHYPLIVKIDINEK